MSASSFAAHVQAGFSKFPRLAGNAEKVVLVGDSVLDNFFWLKDPATNLRAIVEEKLASGDATKEMICVNLAVDQMSTFDFLERNPRENPWRMYQQARESIYSPPHYDACDRDGYRHLQCKDGLIRSALNLEALRNVKHIILSIGGNDVYLDADTQVSLVRSLVPFCDGRAEVAKAYGERLGKVFAAVRAAAPDAVVTPVICYHPHHEFSISGATGCPGGIALSVQRSYLSWMVTPMVQAALRLCMEHGLNVIDLSQTLDPKNVAHYGNMDVEATNWSGAEPSDVSQHYIADLIRHVVTLPPGTRSTIFHGIPNGSSPSLTEVVGVPLTERTVDSYRFHKGVPRRVVEEVSSPPDAKGAAAGKKTKKTKAVC
ncbi:hypothetical protein DIPPA_21544 [Diplonema papillatum]|nr:hypothetical protein DIPPA_21544 [Diplonema papillatum]